MSGKLSELNLFCKACLLNVGKLWVGFFQVRIAFGLDESLVGTLSGRLPFAVACIQLINNVHSLNHLSERREALLVQKGIAFVSSIEKDLGRSRVGSSRSKNHSASGIGDFDGIIGDASGSPLALYVGVAIDSKLTDKARKHSKDASIIEKLFFGQFLSRSQTKDTTHMRILLLHMIAGYENT